MLCMEAEAGNMMPKVQSIKTTIEPSISLCHFTYFYLPKACYRKRHVGLVIIRPRELFSLPNLKISSLSS